MIHQILNMSNMAHTYLTMMGLAAAMMAKDANTMSHPVLVMMKDSAITHAMPVECKCQQKAGVKSNLPPRARPWPDRPIQQGLRKWLPGLMPPATAAVRQ